MEAAYIWKYEDLRTSWLSWLSSVGGKAIPVRCFEHDIFAMGSASLAWRQGRTSIIIITHVTAYSFISFLYVLVTIVANILSLCQGNKETHDFSKEHRDTR